MTAMVIQAEAIERSVVDASTDGPRESRPSKITEIAALIAAIAAGGATLVAVMSYQNAVMEEKLTAAVSPLATSIIEMDKRLTTSIGEMDKRLTNSIGEMDKRLTNSIGEMDKRLTGRLDQVDRRLHQMDQRMDRIQVGRRNVP
ncbi:MULTISPECIES: hypothetical protein [Cupriavidus]|jgi:flagellar capping protein FliD|uniref:Uncharacterized protein n=1 Tax=Cupriavidus metallidurans TaxID=119219 RepID=A0A132HLW5_9BURK|nr:MULTISPECIES: hypothetical protein [Cupriavidus]KWR78972.1 hypothetical protein RN01_22235 [Cupriavidus sp. SHE]KWW36906.1 hypothetical protein AU374_02972 [Cupriavidus metallidurans]QBP09436.1 hypothetical protein DDF84_006535 [Cupriavidus metallidurans]QWC89788.1 hypothetical protein KB891_06230 [Cupriavidus metallidurans]